MASSSSYLTLPHRISFLLPLVVFLFSSSVTGALASDSTALKGVGPDHRALNVSLTWCERIQVYGYSRTELAKYAHSLRLNLAPLVTVRERLHSKIQVCVHRNASLGMCQCEKADWRNLQRGLWSSVMSPYDKQYIDVKFSGDSSASVTVSVAEDFQRWRIVCLVAGLVVILAAPVVSSWLPFYYTSSMAVGVFLVVLVITFQAMRLLPTGRKNFMYLALYGSVVGAGSFILHQFSMMVNMILVNFGLSDDMYNPVAILVLVGIVITGAACGFWTVRKFVVSEDGGVDASVAQFVKWAMRSVAATFIFQSTLDTPLAMGAFVSASFLGFLVSKMIHKRKHVVVQSHWLVPAGKGRSRAEFLSRPGGGGLWNSARRSSVPSSSGSLSNGVRHMISPSFVDRRSPIERKDYYSTYHRTPNRKKLTKREYEELTVETTREAMAGLTASPGFSDWLIERADRIKLLSGESYDDDDDDEYGSESDSTGEQSWRGYFW
uniref:Transmembrane protein 194A n=1 Tax=Noccaea caerulescens TaxID=107243 RepID=A0A1J3E9Y9_NOCCA